MDPLRTTLHPQLLTLLLAVVFLSRAVLAESIKNVAGGDEVDCQSILGEVDSTGFHILDQDAVKATEGDIQIFINCLPLGSVVLVELKEIYLESTLIIDKAISLVSNVGGSMLQCPSNKKRPVLIISSNDVVIESLHIQGCTLESNRGAIHVDNSSGVVFRDFQCDSNTNSKGPGCLSAVRSKITLNNASVMHNTGTFGGALSISKASGATLQGCKFQNNSATVSGGACYFRDSTLGVLDTEFLGNKALNEDAGALWEDDQMSGITASNTTLTGNNTRGINLQDNLGAGGALFLYEMKLVSIKGCSFVKNIGSGEGGALTVIDVLAVKISDTCFINNSALRAGGVFIKGGSGSTLVVRKAYFNGNAVASSFQNEFFPLTGGGILSIGLSNSTVKDTTFVGNVAQRGGGMFAQVNSESHLQISGCVFEGNNVTGLPGHTYGGGLAVHESVGTITVSSTLFHDNNAADIGGAFAGVNIQDIKVVDSIFAGNKAGRNAGAIYVQGKNGTRIEVHRGKFTDNSVDTLPNDASRDQVGGALNLVTFSAATIKMSVFQRNVAQKGGALYVQVSKMEAALKLDQCTFHSNRAEGLPRLNDGGAVNVGGTGLNMTIYGSQFKGNTASTKGGAVLLWKILDLKVEKSSFDSNFAGHSGGGIYMEGNAISTLSLSKVNFTSNMAGPLITSMAILPKDYAYGGGIYMIYLAESLIHKSWFKGNHAHGSGAIGAVNVSSLAISSSLFDENVAQIKGGGGLFFQGTIKTLGAPCANGRDPDCVVTTQPPALRLSLTNVIFSSNHAPAGGGIFASDSVDLYIEGCTFELNHAKEQGGAVEIANEVPKLPQTIATILQTVFTNNTCSDQSSREEEDSPRSPIAGGGALFVQGDRIILNITSVDFVGNGAGRGGAMSLNDPGAVKLTSCNFSRNSANVGGAMALRDEAPSLELVDVLFLRNDAYEEGGALSFVKSSRPTTQDVNNEIEHLMAWFKIVKIRLKRTSFVHNRAWSGGGALDVAGFPVLCDPCDFDSNQVLAIEPELLRHGGGLRIRQGAVLFMESSVVSNCKAGIGGGAYIHNSVLISVNTKWAKNRAVDVGGAIAAEYGATFNTDSSRILELHHCRIEENFAGWGGIQNAVLCTAENHNRTGTLDIPAIPSISRNPEVARQHAFFNETVFLHNTITGTGTAIFSTKPSEVEVCCSPSWQCVRGLDVPTAACLEENSTLVSNLTHSKSRVLGTAMEKMVIFQSIQENHASGNELNPITVELRDAFGASAAVKGTLVVSTLSDGVELSGNPTTGIIINGSSTVKGLKLRALPGSYYLTFRVTPVDNSVEALERKFEIVVRDCMMGEVTKEEGLVCERCKENFYSFDPKQTDCISCPEMRAVCNGSTLIPTNGHWHLHSQSPLLFTCLHKDACTYAGRMRRLETTVNSHPGTKLKLTSLYPQCSEGYTGVLCGSCRQDYGKFRSLRCARCTKKFWLLCILVLTLSILIGLSAFFVRSNSHYAARVLTSTSTHGNQNRVLPSRNGLAQIALSPGTAATPREHMLQVGPLHSNVQRSLISDIIKIFVNFLQATSTAASINIDWGKATLGMLSGMGILSGVSDSVGFFSFSCGFTGDNRVVIAMFSSIGLPIIVWLVFVVYGTISFIRRRYTLDQLRLHILMSALTILHMSYIGIMERIIRVFNCVSVDSSISKLWVEDTEIACYDGLHLIFVGIVGIPFLLFVGLGFPLFLYIKLSRSRNRLHEEEVVLRYSFFYKAYSYRSAYWEAAIYARKALLATVAALGHVLQVEVQIYLALIILLISLVTQSHNHPFIDDKLNMMEATSLSTSALVFMMGGLIHSKKGDENLQGLLLVVLASLIFAFVVYMITELLIAGKIQLELWLQSNGKDTTQLSVWLMIVMATRIYLSRRGVKAHHKWISMKRSLYQHFFTDMSPKDPATS